MAIAFDQPPELEHFEEITIAGCALPRFVVATVCQELAQQSLSLYTRLDPILVTVQANFALKLAIWRADPYALSTMNGQVKQSIGVLREWTRTDMAAIDQQIKLSLIKRAKAIAMITQIALSVGFSSGCADSPSSKSPCFYPRPCLLIADAKTTPALSSVADGSGIIVRRLDSGGWSGPASISTFQLGAGLQFGFRKVDRVIVLLTDAQVEAFMGNAVGVEAKAAGAIGPIGRELSAGAKVGPSGLLTEEVPASDATAEVATTAAEEAASPSPSAAAAAAAAAAASPHSAAAVSPQPAAGEAKASGLRSLLPSFAEAAEQDSWHEEAEIASATSEGTSERKGPGISSTFSYSHAQGWYAGVSAVGEMIHARTADNEEYYGIDGVSVLDILRGKVPKPRGKAALELYALLDALVSGEGSTRATSDSWAARPALLTSSPPSISGGDRRDKTHGPNSRSQRRQGPWR